MNRPPTRRADRRTIRLITALALAGGLLPTVTPATASPPTFVEVQDDVGLNFVGSYGGTFPDVDALGPFPTIIFRSTGNGAAVGDYDGDGDLDVYLLAQLGLSNRLFRNDLESGAPGFTDVTTAAGVGDLGMSRVAHFVDLDNDGDLDLLLLNDDDGGVTTSPSRVYDNQGDGTFVDRSATAGFAPFGYLRCGASLADYDGDGLLDVYVTNWRGDGGTGQPMYPGSNRLYRNLGGFTFQDVTSAAGLGGLAKDSFTAIFHDFDDDHDPDLFVAVDHDRDEYYRNDGGIFVNDTVAVGATHTGNDMGVTCADFDDDGDLDLYATNITDPDGVFGTTQYNVLYVNSASTSGSTSFTDEAVLHGVEDTAWGWGVELTDWELDGDLDIAAVTGFDGFIGAAYPASQILGTPTYLFERLPGGTFTRVHTPDLDIAEDSRALIAFDYDRDGDEDLLITNVDGPTRLLENRTPAQGRSLTVSAVQATGENRNAVGATISMTTGSTTRRRELLAGDSFLAGSPAEVVVGLGGASVVDQLDVTWTDGSTSSYVNVQADRRIEIVQGVTDTDLDGVVDLDDCVATDGSTWAAPLPVVDLALTGGSSTELSWTKTGSGSFAPAFDVLRGSSPTLDGPAVCLATGSESTGLQDTTVPPGGTAFFYGVRTTNACGSSQGPATHPRTWNACP